MGRLFASPLKSSTIQQLSVLLKWVAKVLIILLLAKFFKHY